MDFKVPQTLPQDLLLIQEWVKASQPPPNEKGEATLPPQDTSEVDDDIKSSDIEDESDVDSEDEIAAVLTKGGAMDDDERPKGVQSVSEPSDTSSESVSDSDSESDSDEEEGEVGRDTHIQQDLDDDEDPVPAPTSGTYFQTKHEIAEADITIPEVDEVGEHEVLEKVGEVMNIIDRVAIVRGLPSQIANRGSDRALDSDTLLVFNDRKVMGYIYETFGPTMQPLYQVNFNSSFPLDPERVRVGREVFHVPAQSHFVFVSQIKAMKGSDASNVHDEEPAEDELEFSDDEAEAAHRSRLKRKRGDSRARSVASSRASIPNPTLMRDQDLVDETFFSRNAYDEHGPYDIDYATAGPSSRPAPMPYDDPYGEAYTAPDVAEREARSEVASSSHKQSFDRAPKQYDRRPYDRPEGTGRGEWRGGRGRDRDRDRGGRRDRGRGHGTRGRGRGSQRYGSERPPETFEDGHNSREARSMSPTSLAIARATGQGGYSQSNQQHYQYSYPETNSEAWGYGQASSQEGQSFQQQQFDLAQHDYRSYGQGAMQPMPFVQPHINPRFASAFGLSLPFQQQQAYSPSTTTLAAHSPSAMAKWNDEWLGPAEQRSSSATEEPKNSTQ
ncbi:unnamed protein product [Cyclocybe aegerita]|uniref:H/ACA ribonucleoprotein complex non-core subunit NAF1 n=1 Tax=Cyclocybe aegerita TaxID=1973307 RepID=A0A8S0WSY4_CYCAE|nr:unnamed protein product [Cyclocybe aegerita]